MSILVLQNWLGKSLCSVGGGDSVFKSFPLMTGIKESGAISAPLFTYSAKYSVYNLNNMAADCEV